eukprot:3460129-Rhodomonas_salina.1
MGVAAQVCCYAYARMLCGYAATRMLVCCAGMLLRVCAYAVQESIAEGGRPVRVEEVLQRARAEEEEEEGERESESESERGDASRTEKAKLEARGLCEGHVGHGTERPDHVTRTSEPEFGLGRPAPAFGFGSGVLAGAAVTDYGGYPLESYFGSDPVLGLGHRKEDAVLEKTFQCVLPSLLPRSSPHPSCSVLRCPSLLLSAEERRIRRGGGVESIRRQQGLG